MSTYNRAPDSDRYQHASLLNARLYCTDIHLPSVVIPVSVPPSTAAFTDSPTYTVFTATAGPSTLVETRLYALESQVQQILTMQQHTLSMVYELKAKMDTPHVPTPTSADAKRLKRLFHTYRKSMKKSIETYEVRLDAHSKKVLDSLKEQLGTGINLRELMQVFLKCLVELIEAELKLFGAKTRETIELLF